jgi:hypothetical protein
MAYRTAVSKDTLRALIKRGRPRLSEVSVSFSAVVAIKDINLLSKEDKDKSQDSGKDRRAFYLLVKKYAFGVGAVIAGYEGNTVLVCFGSSLEQHPSLTTYKWNDDGKPIKTYHPIEKACAFVKDLMKNDKISWRFGIDAGECSFSWSPETGFSVNGRPPVRARVLVSKTMRFKARALITNSILEKINVESDKINALQDGNDNFYVLT